MSTVKEIIKKKGNTVWSISQHAKVIDALKLMAEKNVGAVLVTEGERIIGVFSERDFARHAARRQSGVADKSVKDLMTARVICVSPNHSAEECMSLMTVKHVRHLPVFENDKLAGIISIGDVVNTVIEDQKFSLSQLERYVTGEMYR